MGIPEYAEMTYRVLRDTPLSEFFPSLYLPEQKIVNVLDGVPEEENENLRDITLEWAKSVALQDEEFLIAFRDGEGYFRIIHRVDGTLTEALYPEKRPPTK